MSNLKWSTERPTESGNYWLSVHPNKRAGNWSAVLPVFVHSCAELNYELAVFTDTYKEGGGEGPLDGPWLDGAQWALRELPADPFALSVETPLDSWIKSAERLPEVLSEQQKGMFSRALGQQRDEAFIQGVKLNIHQRQHQSPARNPATSAMVSALGPTRKRT